MNTTTVDLTEITDTATGTFTPLHEVTDPAKVDALAAAMAEHGWQGPPIVSQGGSGGNALTGVHRLAAVDRLWNEEGVEVRIDHVDVGELCERYGVDWTALLMDEHDGDTYQAAAALRDLLPAEVRAYLGFDVDGAL